MKKNKKFKTHMREVRANLRNLDKFLLLLIIIFAAIGLVVVFSSSNITAVLYYHYESTYFFKRQLLFTILGVIMMFAFATIIPKKWYYPVSLCGIVGLFFVFVALRGMTAINDSQSWYTIGFATFQPSEFAKTIIIMFLAGYYSRHRSYKEWWQIFVPIAIIIALTLFIATEPDLGGAAIIAFITMLIFFTLPVKNKIIKILKYLVLIGGIGALVAVYIMQPYFINRETTSRQESRFAFTEPCSRSLAKTGYQVCNAYIAINNGGLIGRGFGQSTQKFLYLPEAYTDFVFPIVIEELGLIGSTAILLGYLLLLFKILVIARNATNLEDSIIAFGTFSYILVHIIVNLGGVLALIPMTGIPLPFLSYGGSFLLNLFILLGMTLRISSDNKRFKKGA